MTDEKVTHQGLIKGVSRVAGAHVAAEGVGAAAVLAHLVQLVALVDVLQDDGVRVRLETDTTRTDQIELGRSRFRAFLAIRPPRRADGTAAS